MIIAGKYEVIGELGRGGMGYVYQARHRDLDAVFALKVLLPQLAADPSLVSRFQHEARIMAKLSHPNIVRVSDIARDGDLYYFVMEYIAGHHLGQIIAERGPFAPADATAIALQIADALGYAHARQPAVIHRDIKPSNIMIEDGTGRVVVTDFGIAKLMDAADPGHTRTGFMVGTLRYAAPEQIRAAADLDGRADLYALGLVLYEMIGGRKLFEGMTNQAIIGRQLYEPAENTLTFIKPVPVALQQAIRKAVMKNREQRYASVDAFATELRRLATPSTGATATAVVKPSRRRRKFGWIMTLAAVGALAVLLWPRPEAPRPVPKPPLATTPTPATPAPAPESVASTPDIKPLPPMAAMQHQRSPTHP
ncbi:MAG: serine/threonine-protein kinase [Gammaproteobacteria bacterium]